MISTRYRVAIIIEEVTDYGTANEKWEYCEGDSAGQYRTYEAADKRLGQLLAQASKGYVNEFADEESTVTS